MTILEALADVDETKPNMFDDNMKIRWLSELDGKVYKEVILTHEHDEDLEPIKEYTEADMDKELLIPFPNTDCYRYYLYAMIDFANGETDRFSNSMLMFNNAYSTFEKDYNSTHAPIRKPLLLF